MSFYASFQGRVYLGTRDALGRPLQLRSPGNVAELKVALKTEVIEKYETQTGQRSLDHRMVKQKSATVSLTIEEFTTDNLALALYGTVVQNTGATVTDEPLPATLMVGDRYVLAHPKVTGLVIKDNAAVPATLTSGTHYTGDMEFGAVQFLDITGFTLPLKASYTYGAVSNVGIFTQALPERYLRFEGINTAQGNSKVLVELYRVGFDPLKELSLISDDYNKFDLEGALLRDATKPLDAELGQYGRIVQL